MSSLIDKFGALFEKREIEMSNISKFDEQSREFTILTKEMLNGDYSHVVFFQAVKYPEQSFALTRSKVELFVGTIVNERNVGAFVITDIDEQIFPMDNSSPYPIKCRRFFYKPYEKSVSPESHTPTQQIIQTVNITGNNNEVGNINLSVNDDLEKLNQIEAAIRNSKPSLLHKKQKQEAIELFGDFKDCVIKQKRDDGLFSKFLKVLETLVSATIIGLVQGLISAIPH